MDNHPATFRPGARVRRKKQGTAGHVGIVYGTCAHELGEYVEVHWPATHRTTHVRARELEVVAPPKK